MGNYGLFSSVLVLIVVVLMGILQLGFLNVVPSEQKPMKWCFCMIFLINVDVSKKSDEIHEWFGYAFVMSCWMHDVDAHVCGNDHTTWVHKKPWCMMCVMILLDNMFMNVIKSPWLLLLKHAWAQPAQSTSQHTPSQIMKLQWIMQRWLGTCWQDDDMCNPVDM